MLTISGKYQEIANTLVAESADSSELKTLQDFTNRSATVLGDLYDQYTTQCYERIRFLFGHNYKLSRDDIQIVYTTYNWPQNIQSYLKKSFEQQAQRKRELEGVGHGVAQPTADNLTAAATTTPTITGQQRRPHMRRRPSGVP